MAEDKMDFSQEKILNYRKLRNTGRESEKLWKTLINSFFYLHSEAYEGINVNHRLSLLLNTCDGFIINANGKSNNVEANIANVLKQSLDINLVKYGAELLGIPKNKLFDALKEERNEIDHYVFRKGSLSDYLTDRTDKKAHYANWYFVFVELSIRIALLEQMGYACSLTKKIYAMNEINDWIILGCELSDDCKNPHNAVKQKLQRQGIYMQ